MIQRCDESDYYCAIETEDSYIWSLCKDVFGVQQTVLRVYSAINTMFLLKHFHICGTKH